MYGILLAPFPYRGFDRAVSFAVHDLEHPTNARQYFPIPQFQILRRDNRVFEELIGYYECDVRYNDTSGTKRWAGTCATADSLQFFGVQPFLGRLFTELDGQQGALPVFVMNYRVWRDEFNSNPHMLGRTLVLNNSPRTLIGIMPPRFAALENPDVYLPLNLMAGSEGTSFFGRPASLRVIGRLKPDVTTQAASADLDVIAHRIAVSDSRYPAHFSVSLEQVADVIHGPYRTTVQALFGGVLMLLLIACSNVANLLLARATVRQHEMAVRASLGASPTRLMRQLFVEGFLLATLSGISGWALAFLGVRVVRGMIVGQALPGEVQIGLNLAVLLFALILTVLTTCACGMIPAFHTVRGQLLAPLSSAGKALGATSSRGEIRNSFVVGEVALCIVLMVGAGLMLRTVLALTHVELGFDPSKILYSQLAIPVGHYDRGDQKQRLIRPVLDRIAALPGVLAVTESVSWPPNSWGGGTPVSLSASSGNALVELVSEGYFDTLDMHLIQGRLFTSSEVDTARHLVVVNQAFARRFLIRDDAVSRLVKVHGFDRIPYQPPDSPRTADFEIIGIVTDYRNDGLREPSQPQIFMPYTITGVALNRTIMLRTANDPTLFLKSLAHEVWKVDPDIAVAESGTIESYVSDHFYQGPRFEMRILSAFAGLALMLVAIAVFSTMAYTVSLQTRDIGIRLALGAHPAYIIRMVLRSGSAVLASGVIFGIGASTVAVRLLQSQIWGVSSRDLLTMLGSVATVILVGLAACAIPAFRAASIDPILALRHD